MNDKKKVESTKPEELNRPEGVIVPPAPVRAQYEITNDMDLSIFSVLVFQVDSGMMTMPQARRALGLWFYAQQDRAKIIEEGRPRMRRLKQITEAMYEEWSSLAGQPQV